MPGHAHVLQGSTAFGAGTDPTNGFLAHSRWFQSNANKGVVALYNTPQSVVAMNPQGTTPTGGSQPYNNMMPYMGLTFIIAMQGVFPPRT